MRRFIGLVTTFVIVLSSSFADAQDVAPHLAAGEFVLAKQAARQAPPQLRDPILAQVASLAKQCRQPHRGRPHGQRYFFHPSSADRRLPAQEAAGRLPIFNR